MVKHIMADGRQVKSIDGYVIPSSGRSEVVYRIITRVHTENERKKGNKELLAHEADNSN